MNLYKISAYSDCGSYFAAYLRSVTVAALTTESAKALVKGWLELKGYKFVKPENQWVVTLLPQADYGVVDYHFDSDY